MLKLRPYQQQCVNTMWNALAKERFTLAVMGTGMGKTETFMALAKKANVKTVILVGRNKLVEQTVRRCLAVFDDVGTWGGGLAKRVAQVTVVSIHSADTLTIPGLRFIICDEAHNLNDGRYARFIDRHPEAKLAGFTATPWRNGSEIFGDDRLFTKCHFKRGILKGIEDGFLVPPVSKAMPVSFDTKGLRVKGDDFKLSDISKLVMNKPKIKAQVIDAMSRLSDRKKVVWMCASIEHATEVRKLIPEEASLVHSKQENNDYQMECFEHGGVRHMVSVMMLSEGYDFPAIDAIVLMRPTRSPTLYVQICGRGLRPSPGKENCLVLDYGEVIKNCGPLHDPLTKEARRKGVSEPLEKTIKVCPNCLSYVDYQATECPDCGHELKVERDPLKSLKSEASSSDILGSREPERKSCMGVTAHKHVARSSGNECIRLDFDIGAMWPIRMYGSPHPYSWGKMRQVINTLTPWEFTDWQECYDACEDLVFNIPEWVEVEINKNGFETVKRISDRTRDPNVASDEQAGLFLEEY